MGRIDDLWQDFIEEEKSRLINLPVKDLIALEFFTDCCEVSIHYGLWHETPELRNSEMHSFILMAERRTMFFGFPRKYIAGFSLDKTGKIVPISDEVLYSYD